ncbi:MAG: DUF1553 domain-containing protein, partial [Bryobacterales bacterium]|nr:DUF1553 domain-containing protein [Bryobacterales bacterium]
PFAVSLLLCLPALAQMPKSHPEIADPGRRRAASQLTEKVAGRASTPVAPVARRNFIDEHIFGAMEKDRIPHAPLAGDEEFFRRIHIDFTGRIPDDESLRAFTASTDASKRDKLIDSLASGHAFRAKWTYWFGDLAMAAANRVGNEGKNIFYRWIYDNLQINRPFNELVSDLLTASAVSNWYTGPASYVARWVVIGLTCEDTVHEDTADELAIMSSRHFLGLNLQCVSCHDGARHTEKINLWLTARKRNELWKQAAFFGKTRVLRRVEIATTQDEYSIDEKAPGYDASARTVVRIPRNGPKGMLDPAFILTGERPDPAKPWRAEFARMLTSHPQFARATVNRFWAEMFGVGIVDPVDDFDLLRQDPKNPPPAPWTLQPTHPELLDALADDFRNNGYDVQRLLKLMAKSSAYQLSSKFPGEWKEQHSRYFARKFVRRLKAEEVYDSIVQATGLVNLVPIRGTDFRARYATETRSPEDFKGRSEALKDINFFLESFGQNNREFKERTNDGDITQAVLLMNSPFVLSQVKAQPASYLSRMLHMQPSLTDAQLIERLFQRFLVRNPSSEELALVKDLIATDRKRGYEDLQWLLLNKVEFVFNY